MTPPTMTGSVSEELYEQLAPLARDDEALGWPLLHFTSGLVEPAQYVEDLARDSDDGVGWSGLVDIDRCPDDALAWLGQFVGVQMPTRIGGEADGDYFDRARELIRQRVGQQRGTPATIVDAARQLLTGERLVVLMERAADDAYQLYVLTRTAETPDPDATERAVRAAIPAGLVLSYTTFDGPTYLVVEGIYATYADFEAAFDSYDEAETTDP